MSDDGDEGEESRTGKKRICSGLREDLLACIKSSPCYQTMGMTPKECLDKKNYAFIDPKCPPLYYAFFECKRFAFDNRSRFKGKKGY